MQNKTTKKQDNNPTKEINLHSLAHSGTKEAIDKLEAYIANEEDEGKRFEAQMALGECELFYYSPANKKEEEEFLLCYLIWKRQEYVDDLIMRKASLEARLEKFELEKKVHEKVLERYKHKREAWKYFVVDEYFSRDRKELEETEESIVYEEAWLAEAKKMISTERYKPCIPRRHLEHFDFEHSDSAYDEDCCDCGCNSCD